MNQNLPVQRLESNGLPSEHEMMVYHTVAEQAITSKMYASNFKDKSAVMMIMLAARELGVPPMQALNGGLNIIQGKVEISARMMNALIRKSGHQITIKETSDTHCILVGKRCDTGETQSASFTVAEAHKAGLVKPGGGWIKWPKDMCFARALSRIARQLFSDVIGIGYVEGEIRESNMTINMPVDIVNEPQEIENFSLNNLLKMFPEEDHELVKEYMQVVMKHFNWTEQQCIQKFIEEKAIIDKFNTWKSKRIA